jgi:hypothetical protein
MSKLWTTIDRWGPGAVAVAALVAVIVYGWRQDAQIGWLAGQVAALHGELDRRAKEDGQIRTDIQTSQAYVASLEKAIIKAGINLPAAPKK